MSAALDTKQLVVVLVVALMFVVAAVLVAQVTRSAFAVAAVMAGMAATLVSLGFLRARLQNGEQVLMLEAAGRSKRKPRRARAQGTQRPS